jgi:hypothetical protein
MSDPAAAIFSCDQPLSITIPLSIVSGFQRAVAQCYFGGGGYNA